MPVRVWKHPCCDTNADIRHGAQVRAACGTMGEPVGLQYSRFESMAFYQNTFELKPIRPHRDMADRLFEVVKVR